tara:strand:+ start:597 stop:1928 length:1332 start_codon:yes stop_codon:yes gene_type:complete
MIYFTRPLFHYFLFLNLFLAIGCNSDSDTLLNAISVSEKPQVEIQQPGEESEEIAVDTVETIINETINNKLPQITIKNTEELIRELVSDRNLYLLPGNYKLSSTVYLTDIHNLNVSGADGAVITGDLITLLQFRGATKSITFKNIGFNSTSTYTAEDYGAGIVYFDGSFEDILFENCEFTCPNVVSNGLKFVSQGASRSKNITIYKCNFHDIGRMGFETQNHNYDGIARITDVKVTVCNFERLGTASQYGMAVSVSGAGKNATISNNIIVDAKDRGIENVGWSNITITNNTFSSPNTAYEPITCQKDKGDLIDPYILNIEISGNKGTVNGSEHNLLEIFDCDGLKFFHNDFHSGSLHLKNTINSEFTNNVHDFDGSIGLFVESNSSYNIFTGNTFIVTLDHATTAVFYPSATGNTLSGNTLIKKGQGGYIYNDMDGGNKNSGQ